jgi:hypothetical protein
MADLVNDIGDNGSRPGHFSRHRPSKSNGGCDTVRGAALALFRGGQVSIDERIPEQR